MIGAAVFALAAAAALVFFTLRGMGHPLPEDAARPVAAQPAPPDPPAVEPESVVRRLYAQGGDATSALRALFTSDLAAAQSAAGLRARRDWRYPGEDRPAFTTLSFTADRTSARTAEIRVQWGSWPRRRDVTYSLCLADRNAWRVADVRHGGESLRDLRGLPPPDPLGGC